MTQLQVAAALLSVLLLASAACVSEATAPQIGGSVTRVVPFAVPDIWCPANPDTAAGTANDAGESVCETTHPPAPTRPSAWVDSTLAASDTTK